MTIAGTACAILTSTSTQITCQTGIFSQSSISSLVQVNVQDLGIALNVRKIFFPN